LSDEKIRITANSGHRLEASLAGSHYEGVTDPKRLAEHFKVVLAAGEKFDG
jgi:hypothetical protein